MKKIIPPRPVSLVAAAVAFAIGGIATAQDKTANSTDQESVRPNALTKVIVTGTRRPDRTAAESTAPIDVISGTEPYQVTEQIIASIGGRNIFDVYPDVIDGVDPLTGGLGDGERYPRTGGPFGYNGAFFYARVGVKF